MPDEIPFVKKELEVIVFNPTNLPTIDYHKLSILQGDLKTLSETNKAKLCKSILEHGFFIPCFVWQAGEEMFILDATQRYHALQELEKKGYTIPDIPYIEIEAKDKKDAAQKLLQITSRYGEINSETSFFEDFDIEIDYIKDIAIPELEVIESSIAGSESAQSPIAVDVDFIEDKAEALKVPEQDIIKFEGKDNILVFFSGGKDSTFALYWAKHNFPDRKVIAIFSNHAAEFPGMAVHVVECCEFLEVEYKLIYPKVDMWLKLKQYGWPSHLAPWCQSWFIHKPINQYIKRFDIEDTIVLDGSTAKQAVRISTKTKTSANPSLNTYDAYHPAFDIAKATLESILEKAKIHLWPGYAQGFQRTACWMCPSQNGVQAYALSKNYPGLVKFIEQWEDILGKPLQVHSGKTINDLVEIGRKKEEKHISD